MIVFTNGCFDILHPGHVDLLERAKALGTKLIVGINSDTSARKIKGPGRPFMTQIERAAVLSGLSSVDEVRIFEELTPERLIREIKPDILVKGGDWNEDEIIGSDFVTSTGGKVVSLGLLSGFSSSGIVDRIQGKQGDNNNETRTAGVDPLEEHVEVFQKSIAENRDALHDCSRILLETIKGGGKILVCGNGGSAADAQHIAAEFVGRYETERRALPAIALTTDTSALTAISNDYGFSKVFARQVEALANEGDCLIAISTSGNSPNVIEAVMSARSRGCKVIGMTGLEGKKLASLSDAAVLVPSSRTARIQEVHITFAHAWCEIIDREIQK
jgi:D-sedoheptulose 7-phosphate isomerase